MSIIKQPKKLNTVLLYGLCTASICLCGFVSQPAIISCAAERGTALDPIEKTEDMTALGTATVMTPSLIVKSLPELSGATLGMVTGGQVVDLLEISENGEWAKIKADDLSGYVKTEFLEISYTDMPFTDIDSYINVRLYGAVGDGVTEDTAAICNAFEAAKESGNPLYFPEGEYLIEWGKVVVKVSEKGMKIVGDGKLNSIVKLKEDHNHGNHGNGVIIHNRVDPSISPNVFIKDIGIIYDNSDSTLEFTRKSRLLGLYGYFGKVYVDNCFFHIGGTSSSMPEDSCIFWALGAEVVSIKNCIFENFTNNQLGGGIWIMSDDYDGKEHTFHRVKRVIIQSNELRTTNGDEAIGIYPSSANDNPIDCFKDVLISDNVITHKNWREGTACSPTHGLLTVFVPNTSAPAINANIIISNNTLYSQIAFMETIRVVGFTGAYVSGNKVTVEATTQTETLPILLFGRNAKGIVRDNTFDYSSLTTIASRLLLSGTAEAAWNGNTIKTGGDFDLAPKDGSRLLFEENTVIPLNNNKFIIRKNGEKAKVFVYNNVVYGNTSLNYLYGSNFVVKGNRFNADTETENVYTIPNESETGSLAYQMNEGVTLAFRDTAVTTKIASFKYKGKRSNLKFYIDDSEVPDSAETRDKFFVSCDIQYTD